MHPPTLFVEEIEHEPALLQRRIGLSFCATVLAGIFLCTLCLSGALREREGEGYVVMALPDPPAPLSEPVAENVPLKLEVIATQDAWVEVDTDGENKYRRLIRGEETLSFEAFERIRMMTGNAAGLELRFNGKPVAGTGVNRRLRTLEFTKAGILELNSRNS